MIIGFLELLCLYINVIQIFVGFFFKKRNIFEVYYHVLIIMYSNFKGPFTVIRSVSDPSVVTGQKKI